MARGLNKHEEYTEDDDSVLHYTTGIGSWIRLREVDADQKPNAKYEQPVMCFLDGYHELQPGRLIDTCVEEIPSSPPESALPSLVTESTATESCWVTSPGVLPTSQSHYAKPFVTTLHKIREYSQSAKEELSTLDSTGSGLMADEEGSTRNSLPPDASSTASVIATSTTSSPRTTSTGLSSSREIEWDQDELIDLQSHSNSPSPDLYIGFSRTESPTITMRPANGGESPESESVGNERDTNSAERNSKNQNHQSSPKRKCTEIEAEGNGKKGDGDDEHVRISKRKKVADKNALQFACPFYKRNPILHKKCHQYKLEKISYVKQHLFRSHEPLIRCYRCMAEFGNRDALTTHQRADVPCTRRDLFKPTSAMTEDQKFKLRKRADQKRTAEEQWYEIFDILFPGGDRPRSPYQDPDISEDLSDFREFIETRGSSLVRETILEHGWANEVAALVVNEIQNLFGTWRQQVGLASNRNNEATASDEVFQPQ